MDTPGKTVIRGHFIIRYPYPMPLFWCMAFILMACGKDPVIPAENDFPDPRAILEGTYKMDVYELHIYEAATVDSTLYVITKPEIELKVDKKMKGSQMRIDLREFVENTMTAYFHPNGVTMAIDIKDPDEMMAEKINGGTFEVNDFDFDVLFSDGIQTAIYPFDFNGEGKIKNNKITLVFSMTNSAGPVLSTLEGTASGTRDK